MVKEIVIIGGGIGGVRATKILAKLAREDVHITLVDKSRYHTFHPNLYEVATAHVPEFFGGHLPVNFFDLASSAIHPFDEIFLEDLNVTILEDEVLDIDFKKHKLKLKNNKPAHYDILIIGAGSETNFFNILGLSEKAFELKNFFHALAIRNAVDEAFAGMPKNHLIRIVIGGGGFTGCELASELTGFMKKLSLIHGRPEENAECLIVEASDKLLGSTNDWVQKNAKARLESLGVKLKFSSPIESVGSGKLKIKDGEEIPFDVLVWTAGVKANDLVNKLSGVKFGKAFCVMVDKYLRILPYENVFGVGDITYCVDEITGKSLPMTASVALREAKFVAENVKRVILKKPLLEYKPHHAGFIIPLGGKYALLESHGVKISGILPWFIKHLVALHYWSTVLGYKKAWRVWRQGLDVFIKND